MYAFAFGDPGADIRGGRKIKRTKLTRFQVYPCKVLVAPIFANFIFFPPRMSAPGCLKMVYFLSPRLVLFLTENCQQAFKN